MGEEKNLVDLLQALMVDDYESRRCIACCFEDSRWITHLFEWSQDLPVIPARKPVYIEPSYLCLPAYSTSDAG